MDKSKKGLILWDIDGTLVRSNGAGARAFFKAFQEIFGLNSLKTNVSFAGAVDHKIFYEICQLNKVNEQQDKWDFFLPVYLSYLEKEAKNKSNWELLPGVKEVLSSCCNSYYYGLLTGNVQSGAYIKLGIFDIDVFFCTGGFGDNLTDRIQLAKQALENCQIYYRKSFSPDQIIIIGDTPNDILCAKALECRCYVVTTGLIPFDVLERYEPDKIVDSLLELQGIL